MFQHLFRFFLFSILAGLFVTCSDQMPNGSSNGSGYINFDSLLQAQNGRLVGKKFTKEVLLDGEREQLLFVADSVGLAKDFSLFKALDLSPQILRGEVSIEKSRNQERFTNVSKSGAQEVLFTKNQNQSLSSISGRYYESNFLFESDRDFSLKFNSSSGMLSEYSFSGYQKMLFADTVFFEVTGRF